uniref:Uncharacterized protein n=1 Tax=Pseudomonas phage HRDY3 TaxID=3236930 RepID=A0AB39CEW6_9VIRU
MHAGGYVESKLEDSKKYGELAELSYVMLQELVRLQRSGLYKPSTAVKRCLEKADRLVNGGF